jgi:hypothetical protein
VDRGSQDLTASVEINKKLGGTSGNERETSGLSAEMILQKALLVVYVGKN